MKKHYTILLCLASILYIFFTTTPNEERLQKLESAETQTMVYEEVYDKVLDLIEGKGEEIKVVQGKIDFIRSLFLEAKEGVKDDINMLNTINSWSTEIDEIQEEIIKKVEQKVKNIEEDKSPNLEKINNTKLDIESLTESNLKYPQSQGERLKGKLDIILAQK